MRRLIYYMTILVLLGSSAAFAGDGKIEISQSMVPYHITQPGSYLVTENLSVTNQTNCISILTNNVTIDVGGFTLSGTKSGNTQRGIHAYRMKAITVRNGIARNMGGSGVDLDSCTNTIVRSFQAHDCVWYGLQIGSGIADHNTCTDNKIGILVRSGTVMYNTCEDNDEFGIQVLREAMVKNNSCRRNGLDGIAVGAGSLVENNVANHNGSASGGFAAGIGAEGTGNMILGNVVQGNPYPLAYYDWTSAGITNFSARNKGSLNTVAPTILTFGSVTSITGTHGNVNILLP